MSAKSLKNLFFLIFTWRESQFNLMNQNYLTPKPDFSSSGMENFTLKVSAMFLSDAF